MKLSDSFLCSGNENNKDEFEWTATMLNINPGHNESLHKSCKSLYDYCSYVSKVKENLQKKMTSYDAVENAVNFAIEHDLLNGFFKSQKAEVLNMSLTEFNQEEYDRNRRREGLEEGLIQGAHDKAIETARNFLAMNLSVEQVAQGTGLSVEEVSQLVQK